MIIDITGIVLTPGNNGNDCLGNGECFDENGQPIECCCDECSYMMCCFMECTAETCAACNDLECPHSPACITI